MSTASTEELERRITSRLQEDAFVVGLRDVLVSRPDYEDGGAVVQVRVLVDDPERLGLEKATRLRDAIRSAVAEADDRLPSIRFVKAA